MIVWQSTAIESVKIHAFIKALFTVFTVRAFQSQISSEASSSLYVLENTVRSFFFFPSFPMDRGNAKRLVRDMSAHQISMTSDFDE